MSEDMKSSAGPSSSPASSPGIGSAGGVGGMSAADAASQQDLTIFVQNLLQQMQSRFQTMSNAIIGRIDEMGTRIDDLEKSIGELMAQAGIEEEAERQHAKAQQQQQQQQQQPPPQQ